MPKIADRADTAACPSALQKKKIFAVGLFLLVATFAAYAPAVGGTFIWDDDGHITKPALASWAGLKAIWLHLGATQQYYPMLHSFFWFQYQLWGDDPLPYHVVNILLHVTAATLLYTALKKLAIPGALLAAAVFALHPVEVQSVAWISEQKNTLSAVFYLSSMLLYLKFDQTRDRSAYWLATLLFVMAVLSKTVTATLPAALLVIFWWKRGTLSWRRDIAPLLGWLVLGMLGGILTAWLERKQIGAEGNDFVMSFPQRLVLCGRVIWFYLGKLLWPKNLIFMYPHWTIDASDWRPWLYLAGCGVVAIGLWCMRRFSRAPLAAAMLFVGTLFPVLGFLNVYPFIFSFVADHFQYLAGLAIVVPLCAMLAIIFQRQALIGRGLAGVLLITLAYMTYRQSSTYADELTLYQTTIDRNPQCWLAYTNLGLAVMADNHQKGMRLIRRALEINPTNATALNALGYDLLREGRNFEAIGYLQNSVNQNSNIYVSQTNLAVALRRLGRVSEAIPHFQQAARLRPDLAVAHTNLGNALTDSGKTSQAIVEFQRALEIDPTDQYAQDKLAQLKMDKP